MYFKNLKKYLNAWGVASGAALSALLGAASVAGAGVVVVEFPELQGQERKGSQHFASESCAGKFDKVSGWNWIWKKPLTFDFRYLKKCQRFVFIWNNQIFIGQYNFVCIQHCHFHIVPSLLDFDNCCRNRFISYDNRYSCYFVCTFGSMFIRIKKA